MMSTVADTKENSADGGQWSCAACTFLNLPSHLACRMCGTTRPFSRSPKRPASVQSKATQQSSALASKHVTAPIVLDDDADGDTAVVKRRKTANGTAVSETTANVATSEWPKALDEIIVYGNATRSLARLKAGDAIKVFRSTQTASSVSLPKSLSSAQAKRRKSIEAAKKKAFKRFSSQSKKDDMIVRFGTTRGEEVGRIQMEDSAWLAPLMDQGFITVDGVCVDCPTRIKTMDRCLLQLTLNITHAAVCTEPDPTMHGDEEDKRQAALANAWTRCFIALGMIPSPEPEKPTRQVPRRPWSSQPTAERQLPRGRMLLPKSSAAASSAAAVAATNDEEDRRDLQYVCEQMGRSDADLPEADQSELLACDLRHYQRQALFWMKERESMAKSKTAKAASMLNPLWTKLKLPCGTPIYWNRDAGAVTIHFPQASKQSRGGILADAMGLGKTIECLALVAASPASDAFLASDGAPVQSSSRPSTTRGTKTNPWSLSEFMDRASSSDGKTASSAGGVNHVPTHSSDTTSAPTEQFRADIPCKATLVICPMSVLSQWGTECSKHVPDLSVLTYYGSGRSRDTLEEMAKDYDVILTTYGTVSAEFSASFLDASQTTSDKVSPLFRLHFWRIILDEAHMIKSRSAQVSRACCTLQAERRWAVTGTPIQNRLEDVYTLLKFLRVEPWCFFPHWRDKIERLFEQDERRGVATLQSVLQPLLLRRTKNTRDKHGKPILTLPSSNVDISYLDLDDAEREFYNALEKRSKTAFNAFAASGRVLANYANILELLLRLRQACDHPFLTLKKTRQNGASSATTASSAAPHRPTREETDAARAFGDIEQLIERFMTASSAQSGERALAPGYVEKIARGLRSYALGEEDDTTTFEECVVCLEPPSDPVVTPCAHVGCRICFSDVVEGLSICPACRKPCQSRDLVSISRIRRQQTTQPADADHDAVTLTSDQADVPKTGDSAGALAPQQQAKKQSATAAGDAEEDKPDDAFRPSTKLKALVSFLRAMQQSDVGDKCVVFSQWTSMLDLVEKSLNREGIEFVRLDGSVAQAQRATAIQRFADDDSVSVFLVTLRSGGVGLNLVCANHVVLLDPWWNPAVEEQAIDRVHRIGQTKHVVVKRFVVRNSVEERILELQKRKRNLVHDALSRSDEERRRERMADLKLLFGHK